MQVCISSPVSSVHDGGLSSSAGSVLGNGNGNGGVIQNLRYYQMFGLCYNLCIHVQDLYSEGERQGD